MKKISICIGLAFILSACANDHVIHFDLYQQQNTEIVEPAYTGKSHFILWGLFQETDYDLTNVCQKKGIKSIETHWTLYDSLMNSFSMGAYAPESFSVYCN
jgi:hypothetical protein